MREEIRQLVALGPLPEEDATEEQIARHADLLKAISAPVSDEEARALVKLFSRDGCYELDWSLVHLIESAPSWPIEECLQDTSNKWIAHLRQSAENSRKMARDGHL